MKTFLSKYTSKDDLSADMADMGLEDQMDDDDRPNIQAKYMRQLVRWLPCAILLTRQLKLCANAASHRE